MSTRQNDSLPRHTRDGASDRDVGRARSRAERLRAAAAGFDAFWKACLWRPAKFLGTVFSILEPDCPGGSVKLDLRKSKGTDFAAIIALVDNKIDSGVQLYQSSDYRAMLFGVIHWFLIIASLVLGILCTADIGDKIRKILAGVLTGLTGLQALLKGFGQPEHAAIVRTEVGLWLSSAKELRQLLETDFLELEEALQSYYKLACSLANIESRKLETMQNSFGGLSPKDVSSSSNSRPPMPAVKIMLKTDETGTTVTPAASTPPAPVVDDDADFQDTTRMMSYLPPPSLWKRGPAPCPEPAPAEEPAPPPAAHIRLNAAATPFVPQRDVHVSPSSPPPARQPAVNLTVPEYVDPWKNAETANTVVGSAAPVGPPLMMPRRSPAPSSSISISFEPTQRHRGSPWSYMTTMTSEGEA